jgi:proteasome lid subunit RPN8/RPN11
VFSLFGKKKNTAGPAQEEQRKLYIPEALYRRMINHCQEEKPLEACGLLVGEGGDVLAAYATDNQHRSPVIYKVDDQQLLQVFQSLRTSKQEIIGIYHSHVRTAAEPSRTDIEQATWPESFYVIVSLATRRSQVRAWRIIDRQVTEHEVVVVKEVSGAWHDLRKAVRG